MCTFSRYPGRHATDVRVKMFKGIAAVIGNLIVNSVTYEVLVLLDREGGPEGRVYANCLVD